MASPRGPIACRRCRPSIAPTRGASPDPRRLSEEDSMSRRVVVMVIASICLLAGVASAEVQRLYVLDCGRNIGKDQARWSPGVNEGRPIEFSDNCYLIRHDKGLVLWDTGVPGALAAMREGMVVANGASTYRRTKPRAGQPAGLGVKPPEGPCLAASGTHADAGLATADPGRAGRAPRAAVDQPRQGAERRPALRARVLRVVAPCPRQRPGGRDRCPWQRSRRPRRPSLSGFVPTCC